jgi:hypothetical protein
MKNRNLWLSGALLSGRDPVISWGCPKWEKCLL